MSRRNLPPSRSLPPPVPEAFDASGAFETCRVKGGKVVNLRDHLERLKASLNSLGIPWQGDPARRALMEAGRGLKKGYVRIAVRRWGTPSIVVHRQPGVPYSSRTRQRGIVLRTVPTRWPLAGGAPAQVKGSERLSGVLARLEGEDAAEVLRIGPHGYLTEGTASNLFLVRHGTLATPPAWLGVLEGVTRARLIKTARALKIPVTEIPLTRHELFNAEEAFLTNVLMGILPIRQVDGRRIGLHVPGPITRRLMRRVQ